MSKTIAFDNVYMSYIENKAYEYPSINAEHTIQGSNVNDTLINTGWHIIPNFLWRHCVTPRQWDGLIRECEAYKIKSVKCVVYNPIPITTNISLQRTSLFSAFNNCTYALTYTDDCYETDWYPWLSVPLESQLHLSQREGLTWIGPQTTGNSDNYRCKRYQWPIYQWRKPNMRTIFPDVWSQGKQGQAGVHDVQTGAVQDDKLVVPNGVFWDPFNLPDKIGELRAGKNSISFSWNVSAVDEDKWFNTDVMAAYSVWGPDGPYCGVGRPGTIKETTAMDPQVATTYGLAYKVSADNSTNTSNALDYNDYTIPCYTNQPLMPTKWFWKELQESIVDWLPGPLEGNFTSNQPWWWRINQHWAGTEKEAAHYPPNQWFIKGIPLYDVSDQHIRTSTQVSAKITLIIEGKTRRSAYYCPTYGPISGQQLYYQSNDRNIFQPAAIRYRTGGMRRTWQNIHPGYKFDGGSSSTNETQNIKNIKTHPRITAYKYQMNVNDATAFTRDCRYNQGHRPTGMKDVTGANKIANLYGNKESQPTLRVRWTRATDSTEIIMEDDEETPQTE